MNTAAFPMIFGTMQFGGNADADASRAMFENCLDADIKHFDTACGYNDGASETLLGLFVHPIREKVFVATKVGYFGGAGRENILSQFDGSRMRLQMDQVDLLYLHRFDPATDLRETFATMADLQDRGLIKQIGVSNYAAWQVMKAQAICESLGTKINAIQPMFNLVKRQAEVELLPMAEDQGMQAYCYSPLGGGLLTGKYDQGGTGRLATDSRYAARYAPAHMRATAKGLTELSREIGVPAPTLAVAWVMRHPAKAIPIISARSVNQLAPSLAAMTYRMDDAVFNRLNDLSVAPPPATDRLEEA